jgi:hypothetical protein
MIRNADEGDFAALLEMAERFITKAYARIDVPFDRESCEELLWRLLENEDGILLTNDDCTAMFGALVHGWHFNTKIKTATELFWWREDGCTDARAMKLRGEDMARALGAATMNMANQEHMRSPALSRLYRMDGYVPSENIFIKELG